MSATEIDWKGSGLKLLPHQTALVQIALDPSDRRIVLLRADVGLGKTTALAAVTRRLLDERPMARVLMLIPAVLREQVVEMLRDRGAPTGRATDPESALRARARE